MQFIDYTKKYGKVFTFWFGTKPVIMIFDLDVGREVFKQSDCCGRATLKQAIHELFNANVYKTFILEDYNSLVINNRKVSIDAIR